MMLATLGPEGRLPPATNPMARGVLSSLNRLRGGDPWPKTSTS